MKLRGNRLRSKRHIVRLVLAMLIGPMVLFGTSIRALAGDINGEEARVISAASGVFYYNNEAYAAKGEYINQLAGYLAQDGVDLTAGQADAAISEMYASIGQGVAEGYLYKLSDTDEETTEEETTEEETTEEETTEEESKPLIMVIPETTTEAVTTESVNLQTTEATTEASATTEETIEQIDEEDANAAISFDVETHTIIYEDKENHTKKELPSINKPLDVSNYANIGVIVSLIILAVILLFCTGLYLGKCFPWQKKKRNRKTARYYVNHKMRRVYRKITGNTFTLFIACHVLAGTLLLGIGASVFRQSFVIDNLTSSGYFRYIYDDMNQTIQRELEERDQVAVASLSKQVGYDTFLSIAKTQTKNSLSGIESRYDLSSLSKKLMEVDCNLSKEEQEIIVNIIIGNIQTYSADMVGSSIYGIKQGYRDFIRKTLPVLAINMICMILIVLFMDRYHHRGIRYIARGVIAGSAIAMIASALLYVTKPYTKVYMQPASLYLFMRDYVQHAVVIVGAVACIAALIGVLLMALVGVVRKKQMDD